MSFSGTKQGDRDASEYPPNHFHVERGGSKTHPVGPPAASYQHAVLTFSLFDGKFTGTQLQWFSILDILELNPVRASILFLDVSTQVPHHYGNLQAIILKYSAAIHTHTFVNRLYDKIEAHVGAINECCSGVG